MTKPINVVEINSSLGMIVGFLLITVSLVGVASHAHYLQMHNSSFPFFFFAWAMFMLYGHTVFIGLALIHRFKWKLTFQIFHPKIWYGFGFTFLLFSIFGLLNGLELGFASFRTWIIWSAFFLSILYLYGKYKLDHFQIVFLSFLTVVVATELWELPILLKFIFVPHNPAQYLPIEILTRFILLNSKLLCAPLLVAWARIHSWKPTKLFLAITTLVILSYIPLILTGWEEWWYRLIMFPLAFAFIRGFPK